jgi:hypothetical protein
LRAVNAEPLSVPSVSVGRDALLGDRSFDDGDRLGRAAADLEAPADDLARAAVDDRVQVAPAVLGDPDRGHVHVPQLAGPLDPEESAPTAARLRAATLDQPVLAHHAQDPLAVDRDPELAARERPDHPVAVGRVLSRHLDDRGRRPLRRRAALGRRPRLWGAVEGLPADAGDARHTRQGIALGDQHAGPGDAHAHSQPADSFPAISSS